MDGVMKQYAWVLYLAFTLACAYFSAKIVNLYVASLLETPRSIAMVDKAEGGDVETAVGEFSTYSTIIARNIFDSAQDEGPLPCGEDDPRPECKPQEKVEKTQRPTGEAVKTSLRIKVLATMSIGDGKDSRSSATIEGGKGNEVDVYAVGDPAKTFQQGVELVKVLPKRIEFLNRNRLEYAELLEEESTSIFVKPDKLVASKASSRKSKRKSRDDVPNGDQIDQVEDGKFVINQAEVDAALSQLDQLYTQIRAVPNFQDGKVQGMKILSIKPGSLFAKLGLRRGDILDRINDQEIDIKKGFELFSQLREQKTFKLDLVRKGKTESFEYEIR